jgi:hypothetical protein
MRAEIVASLGVTAMRATRTLDRLLESSNEMAKLGSARYVLGSAFGIQPPPAAGGPSVNISIERAGYIIDVSESDRPDRIVIDGRADISAGPLIEGEVVASEVDAEPRDRE